MLIACVCDLKPVTAGSTVFIESCIVNTYFKFRPTRGWLLYLSWPFACYRFILRYGYLIADATALLWTTVSCRILNCLSRVVARISDPDACQYKKLGNRKFFLMPLSILDQNEVELNSGKCIRVFLFFSDLVFNQPLAWDIRRWVRWREH